MHRIRGPFRGLLAILSLAALAGCENELPTLTGEERFPDGTLPTTVEVVLSAQQFLLEDTLFSDFTNSRDVGFLLVAERFDGVLTGHTLARLTGFPDSVTFTVGGAARTEAAFTYGA